MTSRASMEDTEYIFNARLNPGSRVMIDAMKRNFIQMVAGSLPIWSSFVNSEERKFRDWATITARMNQFFPEWNFTVEQLKIQWKILRDSYKRERNRLLADKTRMIKWKFYKELQFLEDSGMFGPTPPDGVEPSSEEWVVEHQKLASEMLERSKMVAQANNHYLSPECNIEGLTDGMDGLVDGMEIPKDEKHRPETDVPDFSFNHLFEGCSDNPDSLDALNPFSNTVSVPSPSRSTDGGASSPVTAFFSQHIGINGESKNKQPGMNNGKPDHQFTSSRKRQAHDAHQMQDFVRYGSESQRRDQVPGSSTPTPAPTQPVVMDKFELLGKTVAQTLRDHFADDELSVEEAFIGIEEALHNLRKEVLMRRKRMKRDNDSA
ncbi:unnamed protein product, partial [Mesorhabditis spiculigera]